jgi:prophage regulatory protein
MSQNQRTTTPILRKPELTAAIGRSNSSLYLDIKAGLFTPGVKLSTRAVGWPADEVRAIMSARIAGKTDGEIKSLVGSLIAARKRAS